MRKGFASRGAQRFHNNRMHTFPSDLNHCDARTAPKPSLRSKDHAGKKPHRNDVVTAKRPERSEGAAQQLDHDEPMRPLTEMGAFCNSKGKGSRGAKTGGIFQPHSRDVRAASQKRNRLCETPREASKQ
jgi:hypothetical protein